MRLRDTGSLTVVCGMPTVSTALRVKPAARGRRARRGAVPVLRGGQTSRYVVDSVLGDAASQQEVYQELVAPLVDNFVQGENVVLLAYGAAATGKSYTMQGGTDMGSLSVSSDDAGMILRATHAILRSLSIVPKAKYCLSVTYCGLTVGHEAQLMDLLSPAPAASAVSLRDGSAAAALAGLTCWAVEDPCDVLEALRSRKLLHSSGGLCVPKGGGTNSSNSNNKRGGSSMMHSMLTLQLDSYTADGTLLQRNTLAFVELAAPEPKDPLGAGRTSGSESASARSLAVAYSTLSKVLSALRNTSAGAASALGQAAAAAAAAASITSQQQQQQLLQHVPWRDSPLTRWLQDQLHAANAIVVLGTISTELEAATDCLTTVTWVSRFSAASRSGADGVIASFAWEALADPEGAPGCYIRFHPDPQEQQQHHAQQAATVHGACSAMCSSPMAKLGSPNLQYCESAASPHSTRPRSAGSVCQLQGRWQQQQHEQSQQQQQQQLGQGQHNQLAARRPPSPLRGSLNTQMWQQQGLRSTAGIVPAPLQQHHHLVLQQQHSGGRQSPCQDIAAAAAAHSNNRGAARTQLLRIGAGADECAAAAAAGGTLGGAADKHTAAAAAAAADDDDGSGFEQQQHHADERGGAATDGDVGHKDGHGGDDDDEVLLYGELMSALRRGGGGSLRSEAILEQLLQELGAARAALSAERGEARALKARLKDVEEQHAGCGGGKKELQEQVQDLQRQLEASQKQLKEVSGDRDLFLRRLQQLELEGVCSADGSSGGGGSGSGLELQRQKAHAAQLRMMEAELNALASSNQQLRSQLELSSQHVSAAGRDKLAAQDAAAEATGRLQQKLTMALQEIDMLRSAGEIEGAVRKEMEATADELRRACDAATTELASVTADKAQLSQQHDKAQESIDALVAELQDTLGRLEQQQQQAGQLSDRLQQVTADAAVMQKQLSSAQAQVTTLQALVQQLEQQKQQTAEASANHQAEADSLARILQDLQLVFSDFELDLDAALPQHWQQLLKASTADASTVSPHSIKLRSRLLSLLAVRGAASKTGSARSSRSSSRNSSSRPSSPAGGHSKSTAAASGAGDHLASVGPSAWAGKLQGVVEVLELAGQERGHVWEDMLAAKQRAQLLETNVQELQKLVSTQEALQQQLTVQLDAGNAASDSHKQELQSLAEELKSAQQQLEEAQAAAAALAGELQESQAALKAAGSAKDSLAAQLSSGQAALGEREAALDALADELVAVSGLCDEQTAAKEHAEEQVVSLAGELEDALTLLCANEQLLEQVWTQLTSIQNGTAADETQDGHSSSSGGGDAQQQQPQQPQQQASTQQPNNTQALSRAEQLQKLKQKQKQQLAQALGLPQGPQQQQIKQAIVAGLVRRLSSAAEPAAAGILHQAVVAAVRRSSQCSDTPAQDAAAAAGGPDGAAAGKAYRLQQHQQQQKQKQQQKQQQTQQQQPSLLQQQQHSQRMQCLVLEAMQAVGQHMAALQRELQVAHSARFECEQQLLLQAQQLQRLREQQQCDMQQVQEQKQRLLSEVAALGQHLMVREQELRQAQRDCQDLDAAVRELQRQVQHQHHHNTNNSQHQQQQPADGSAAIHSSSQGVRLDQVELQLADCRRQLVEAKTAAAESAAALAAERAARVAAEDREAGRRGLMERLTTLQAEVEGLHAALLQEKRGVVALRDELGLMTTSRDTWRDAAKRAEVKLQEAQAAGEQRSTELTRARAEVLQLRQELDESTQQMLLLGTAQQQHQQHSNSTATGVGGGSSAHGGGGNSGSSGLQDSLAARLATAQVLKREAEERAAELARKLSVAQARLAELQQQADDSEADMGSQLYQAQAQLVRAKADLAASRAAAVVAAATAATATGQHDHHHQQQQQQQQAGNKQSPSAPAPADRQRSVAAQLETAEQLMRSMRATAAAALSDSGSAAGGQLEMGDERSGAQEVSSAVSARHSAPSSEPQSVSPFKAWSAAPGSLDQHMHNNNHPQHQQQQQGARAGDSGSGSKSGGTPKSGGWLYNRLFASKEQIGSGEASVGAWHGGPGGGDGTVATQERPMRGANAADVAAAGAEAPCLY